MTIVSFVLDEELKEQAQEAAKKEERSFSNFVRVALKERIEKVN
jgi:predicted transcriptional regulator